MKSINFTNLTLIDWHDSPRHQMIIRLNSGQIVTTHRPENTHYWLFDDRSLYDETTRTLWDRRMAELWNDLMDAAYDGADWPSEYRPKCEAAAAMSELDIDGCLHRLHSWSTKSQLAAMASISRELSEAERDFDDHEETLARIKKEIATMQEDDFK